MKLRELGRPAAAALLAFGLAGQALAQGTPSANPPAAAPPPGQSPGVAPPERMAPLMGTRADRVERHVAELKRRLKITPAQQPQWDAFAKVMRDNAAEMDKAFEARAQNPNMTAVDDLRAYATIVQTHAEDVQRLVPVFEALYGTMSPEQQRTADSVFRDFEQRQPRRKAP